MSIRVTKEGVLPEDQLWIGTCCRCGCEVEAAFGELSTSPNGWGYGCSCPTTGCGHFIVCQTKSEVQRYVDKDKVRYEKPLIREQTPQFVPKFPCEPVSPPKPFYGSLEERSDQ